MSGGFCQLPVPYVRGPLLRFQSPLVKPDVQIARIRLSPVSSGLRARQVGPAAWQAVEAERLVEDTPTLAGKPVLGSLLVDRAGTALMAWLGCALNPADFTSSKPSISGPLWWSPVLCTFL